MYSKFLCLVLVLQALQGGFSQQNQTSGSQKPPSIALQVLMRIHNLHSQIQDVVTCSKPKDCSSGFKCDFVLGQCTPFDVPNIPLIEKTCQNASECSELYSCINGACQFCGPKVCSSNDDCCFGIPKHSYQCMSLPVTPHEEMTGQLSKPTSKKDKKKGSDESHEKKDKKKGKTGHSKSAGIHGQKRCWAECLTDADCQCPRLKERMGGDTLNLGCCRGVCIPKDTCYGMGIQPQVQSMFPGLVMQPPATLQQQPQMAGQGQAAASGGEQTSATTQTTTTELFTTSNIVSDTEPTTAASTTEVTTTEVFTTSDVMSQSETSPETLTDQTETGASTVLTVTESGTTTSSTTPTEEATTTGTQTVQSVIADTTSEPAGETTTREMELF